MTGFCPYFPYRRNHKALRFESYTYWYMNHRHFAASSKELFSSCSDAADQVVQGKGKFEELMVCSHEIAASTAQLVAASKVQRQQIASNVCSRMNFQWYIIYFIFSGKSRQGQYKPFPPPAGLQRGHPGHRRGRGINKVRQVSDWGYRWVIVWHVVLCFKWLNIFRHVELWCSWAI